MKNNLYLIACILFVSSALPACFPTDLCAKDIGLGFVLDVKGRPQKVFLHTRKKLHLTPEKGFPSVEQPVALSIKDTASDKETARIKLEWVGMPFEGYALGADRIVLNGVVWDWRKNRLRSNHRFVSGSPESISGLSPDEKFAVVPSNYPYGLVFYDIERGTSVPMYKGLHVRSPRFSPDGRKWAFFTRDQLIIRLTGEDREKRVTLPTASKDVYAFHLAWSPSGRYIAGLITENGDDKLVLWDADGNYLKTVKSPRGTTCFSWSPVWVDDEKSVYVVLGNEGLVGKFEPLQLKLVPLW